MFDIKSEVIIWENQKPTWQYAEDEIVGRMYRQLLDFENGVLDMKTIRAMEFVIESSAMEAERIGARGDYVRSVGARIFANGKSLDEWKRIWTLPRCSTRCWRCGADPDKEQ